MDRYQAVVELAIEYQIVEHEPALTTEQADHFIEGMEGFGQRPCF